MGSWASVKAECMFDLINWSDISPWVRKLSITQGSSRVDGPIVRMDAGECTLTLDNRDRRFDRTNLAGPYTSSLVSSGSTAEIFTSFRTNSHNYGVTINVKSAAGQNASILNVTSTASGTTTSFTVAKPTGTVSGKVMIAIHTCDVGTVGAMTLTGGSTWNLIDSASAGDDTIQNKVFWKVAGGSEPSSYTFGQASNADGVATVIVLDNADTVSTPHVVWQSNPTTNVVITPAGTVFGTNDLELRWAAGTWPGGGSNTWDSPTGDGYIEYVDKQSNSFTTAALAAKQLTGIGTSSGSLVLPERPIRFTATFAFTPTTNLIQNPSFESDATGWVGTTAQTTLKTSMDFATYGGTSLQVIRNATEPTNNYYGAICNSTAGGTSNGQVVTISFWVWIPAASYSKITSMTILGTGFASLTVTKPVTADGWYRVTATRTLSATLDDVQIRFFTDNTHGDGQTVAYIDAVQAEVQSSATDYCDGNLPGCTWTGGENSSSSTRPATATFDLFYGFAEDWLIDWTADVDSEVTVPISDGFRLLTGDDRPAVAAVGAGESSDNRVIRILDSAGWSASQRDISAGDITLQATTLEGDALAELQLVSDTEIGEIRIGKNGDFIFRNRESVLSSNRALNNQARFGDGGSLQGEYDYDHVTISNASDQLFNQVRAVRVGGAEQMVEDLFSIANITNGIRRTFTRDDLIMTSDAEALSWGQWVLYISKDPELRFETLTIKPQKNENILFPLILGLDIGDRVAITRRPVGGGDPVYRECFIRGINHEIEQWEWTTTYVLQSATKIGSFLTLNHQTLGIIGQNALVP